MVEAFMAKGMEALSEEIETATQRVEAAQAQHDEFKKQLQKQYEESDQNLKKLQMDHGPAIKLMKACVANLTAAAAEADPAAAPAAAAEPKAEL